MIDDPDKEPARWDEPIIAGSSVEAEQECQRRAASYDVQLESVTEPRKVEKRNQLYRCNYKENT